MNRAPIIPTTPLYEDSLLAVFMWAERYAHSTIADKVKREAWLTAQFDLPKRMAIAAALLRRGVKPNGSEKPSQEASP